MANQNQVSAALVREFIDSYPMKDEFRNVLFSRLNGLTGGQDGILTSVQLNDIFEGSPSLKAAFEKTFGNNS